MKMNRIIIVGLCALLVCLLVACDQKGRIKLASDYGASGVEGESASDLRDVLGWEPEVGEAGGQEPEILDEGLSPAAKEMVKEVCEPQVEKPEEKREVECERPLRLLSSLPSGESTSMTTGVLSVDRVTNPLVMSAVPNVAELSSTLEKTFALPSGTVRMVAWQCKKAISAEAGSTEAGAVRETSGDRESAGTSSTTSGALQRSATPVTEGQSLDDCDEPVVAVEFNRDVNLEQMIQVATGGAAVAASGVSGGFQMNDDVVALQRGKNVIIIGRPNDIDVSRTIDNNDCQSKDAWGDMPATAQIRIVENINEGGNVTIKTLAIDAGDMITTVNRTILNGELVEEVLMRQKYEVEDNIVSSVTGVFGERLDALNDSRITGEPLTETELEEAAVELANTATAGSSGGLTGGATLQQGAGVTVSEPNLQPTPAPTSR